MCKPKKVIEPKIILEAPFFHLNLFNKKRTSLEKPYGEENFTRRKLIPVSYYPYPDKIVLKVRESRMLMC